MAKGIWSRSIKRVVQEYSRDTWSANFTVREFWKIFFVTWKFCVTRVERKLFTDTRDFTTLFCDFEAEVDLAFYDFSFF